MLDITAKTQVKKLARQSARETKSKNNNKQQSARSFDTYWKASLADYVAALAWSVNGDYLAAGAASGEILLWTGAHSVLLRPAASEQAIGTLEFSANGQYLAAAGQQGSVFVWDLNELDLAGLDLAGLDPSTAPQPTVTLENPHCWIDRLAWHPSQPWLAFGAGGQVKVWDISQEKSLSEQSFAASSVFGLAWHPDGQQLAASGHTGVKVWSVDDWGAPPELIEVPGASLSLAWSADGAYLASGNLDRTLTVVSLGNPPPWLMQGFPGKVRQVAWARTSEHEVPVVAAACMEGITVWRRQGKNWQSKVLEKHKGTVEAIAFHPTKPLLASAAQDGQLCLWKKAALLQQTLWGVKAGFSAIAWHPQGRYLAAGGSHGELMVWAPSNRGTGFQRR
ncbi:MAG: WD40 repeat domain-containing protein [Cyanobacteria bacterium P01_F01_bin.53]